MAKQVFDIQITSDIISNVITTTAQTGEPDLTIIAPFIAGDLLYSAGIKQYITNNFGGNQGISDEYARDVLLKTTITGFTIWIAQTFTGQGVGLLEGTLNAFVSYTASNGFIDILNLNEKSQ